MTQATETHDVPEFDPVAAFEGILGGADEPQRDEDTLSEPAAAAPEPAEPSETSTEPPATEAPVEPRAPLSAADDDEMEVTVNGEAKRVAVKDLKALFERNEQITHQSAAIEARQQAIEAEAVKYTTALQGLAQNALSRYQQYAQIDWVDARVALSPDQYQALRAEAERATQEAQYFEGQLTQVVQQQRDAQLAVLRERAVEAVKVLKDPTTGIAGWNDGLYKDIQDYAVNTLGAPRELVQSIVDPWAIKAIHAAMLYSKGQASLKASPVSAKPVVPATGTRALTSSASPDKSTPGELSKKAALAKLRDSGDLDDATNAFMALLP